MNRLIHPKAEFIARSRERIPTKFTNIIPKLIDTAMKSSLNQRVAASILDKNNVSMMQHNMHGNTIDTSEGSEHAEVRAMRSLLKKNIWFNNTWRISDKKLTKNLDLMVIRISNHDNIQLVNARPCHKCLNMMKTLGFRRVHYTDETGNIITENIRDMISLHSSFVTVKLNTDTKLNNEMKRRCYYEKLLHKIPETVKQISFELFLINDMKNILGYYKIIQEKNKVIFCNCMDIKVKQIYII